MIKQLLIILIIYILYNNFCKKETKKQLPLPKSKPLMFGSESCPYTVKMIKELKSKKIFKKFKYIDTDTEEGNELMEKYDGEGVPFFIHKNKKAYGYMKTSVLLKKLKM